MHIKFYEKYYLIIRPKEKYIRTAFGPFSFACSPHGGHIAIGKKIKIW